MPEERIVVAPDGVEEAMPAGREEAVGAQGADGAVRGAERIVRNLPGLMEALRGWQAKGGSAAARLWGRRMR